MQNSSVLLIVEDDAQIRALVAEILSAEGYEIIDATNGAEGLAVLSKVTPALILLDLQMPVMNGWAFMDEVQHAGIAVPILVMSAQEEYARKAKDLGAVDYVAKPFELGELLKKVARYQTQQSAS